MVFGGLIKRPGDLVIGDDDGLVVLGPAAIRSLIDDAEAKLEKEAGWQTSLASGRSMSQTLGFAAAIPSEASP